MFYAHVHSTSVTCISAMNKYVIVNALCNGVPFRFGYHKLMKRRMLIQKMSQKICKILIKKICVMNYFVLRSSFRIYTVVILGDSV